MSEEKRPQISLKKIAFAVIGVITLFHLEAVFEMLNRITNWFAEGLEPIRDFPEGARAAIAFMSILLCLVVLLKIFNKI